MRLVRVSFLIAAACLTLAASAVQGASQGEPKTVDDVIANILKQAPKPDVNQPAPVAAGDPSVPAVPAAAVKEAVVMGARIGEHPDRTRFVVELSDPVAMRTFTLNNPNRVVIDMPAVRWHLEGPPRPSGNGAVRSYRYGMFRPGNARFVIDLNQPVVISDALVLPPENGYGYRVVIDLFPTTQAKFDSTAGWPQDLRARESRENAAQLAALPKTPPPPSARKVIVIDAGHGGVDPGTSSTEGVQEKDVVLAAAHALKKALNGRGYSVHMTRDDDVFIELPQRVRIARSWRADLFISLHADSSRDPAVNGLSIYTLSEKGSDAEAAALARKENESDKLAGVDLSGDNSAVAPILIDLAQRDTMNKSSHFAETAITELRHETDILPRQPHRSAGFAVLKAPDVPAVLIELGYLSNDHDAGQMQTGGWRARVAGAIATAVDRQFAAANPATAGN
jgi:N-acetylmuramoyl-L-alanine amidase